MPVEFELTHEGRVLIRRFSDPISMKEVYDAVEQGMRDYLDKAEKPVYVVTDVSHMHHIPSNALSTGRGTARMTHPREAQLILVTPGAFVYALGTMAARFFVKDRLLVFKTMDEALKHVAAQISRESSPEATSTSTGDQV